MESVCVPGVAVRNFVNARLLQNPPGNPTKSILPIMQNRSVRSLPLEHNLAANEEKRLTVLHSYGTLDAPIAAEFDALTRLAAYICGAPIALISLLDDQRQWFLSKQGMQGDKTPGNTSFCRYTIQRDELFEVPDALLDERFNGNPLVAGPLHIRHYCGAPLVTPGGYRLGSLCVIDQNPKRLDDAQKGALRTLAGEVMMRLELKRQQQLHWQKQQAEYNQKRFGLLFEHSQGYLYTHTLSGAILAANAAAVQALQYGAKEIIGRNIVDFLITETPQGFGNYLQKIRAEGVVSGTVRVRTGSGEERYWQFSNVLCEDPGYAPFVICSAYDVTNKQVAQQILLQAEEELKNQVQLRTAELSAVNAALESTREELEAFLYRASHDLRGPVCSLKGVMYLMETDTSGRGQEAFQGMMQQTLLKLEHAMENILHYTNNRYNYLDYEKVGLAGRAQPGRGLQQTRERVSSGYHSKTDITCRRRLLFGRLPGATGHSSTCWPTALLSMTSPCRTLSCRYPSTVRR
jgi:PAS domain S-box-containing protein